MLKCRNLRGLIAASLYGELEEQEREALEAHMSSCARCRAEYKALGRLKAALASGAPELDRDLVPVLRARLAEQTGGRRRETVGRMVWLGWRVQLAGGLCLALVALLVYQIAVSTDAGRPSDTAAAPNEAASPLQPALQHAAQLSERRDFAGAYAALKEALEAHPDDGLAGQAQARLADIAFAELHWYREAYKDYRTLAGQYPGVYTNSPECIERMDLLAEAREKDYDPLYRLDAARGSRDEAFGKFEGVIALYPGTYTAALAAEEMARCVAREGAVTEGAEACLAAMEQAKERCTHPIAITQLQLEIAHIHRALQHNGTARDLYQEVADSDTMVLANLARESLAKLPSSATP